MGHVARDGRYNDGGTAGTWRVEVWRDGEALRALCTGAIAGGGGQTGYIFVYTAESEMRELAQTFARRDPVFSLRLGSSPRDSNEPSDVNSNGLPALWLISWLFVELLPLV